MVFTEINPDRVDQAHFQNELDPFLPDVMFDAHVHVWKKEHRGAPVYLQRGEDWPERIEIENTAEMVSRDYAKLFPGRKLEALVFGWVGADVDIDANNRYVGEVVRSNPGWHGLAVVDPSWSREKTEQVIEENGLDGMKPYITFADSSIPTGDITIFDILSHPQWELANEKNYVCTLHLPRAGRLPDPKNIEQLLEIEEKYPQARVIVAHIGRCYSNEDLGDAMEKLRGTKNMCFDFSGNTNPYVIRRALETFGPDRVLYGSDLPISHIHLKRIYENGHYVNLIRPQERPQINEAPYMRPMPDADRYTFFLYETVLAFRQAAMELGLTTQEIQNVMFGNARRLLKR